MREAMTPEDRDALAGELALGVLDEEDRARALRLKLSDPAFAALVRGWEERLGALSNGYIEMPPPDIWAGIEKRLTGATDAAERRVRPWRWATIASGALAASLGAILILRPVPVPVEIVRAQERTVMAQLSGGEGGALLAASYDPDAGLLRIRAVKMPASDLAPELWVIPVDGVPRSLGLVSAEGLSRVGVPVPHRALMQDGATLAITMEPSDGAPHRAPSSAPVAAGKISTI